MSKSQPQSVISAIKLWSKDNPYAKPGALLHYLGWAGLRVSSPPLKFRPVTFSSEQRNYDSWEVTRPKVGDVMMIVTPPFLVSSMKGPNGKPKTQITVQVLCKENLFFVEWNYTMYGFSTFFDLKHTPTNP